MYCPGLHMAIPMPNLLHGNNKDAYGPGTPEFAKNSLANVDGYSPNMLVFGRNPNYPTAFVNKPPGNNMTCINDYVAENHNAMHSTRKVFIQQESAEHLRRALNRKSRSYSNQI